MKANKVTYAKSETHLYEAMRWMLKNGSCESEREGKALIDPTKTFQNTVLYLHPCLTPHMQSNANRGKDIAAYHKLVTGCSARMSGAENQLSKAFATILTLPRDYLPLDFDITDEEYEYMLSDGKGNPELDASIRKKLTRHEWTEEERQKVNEFFQIAFAAWKKVCSIRDEDVLYAVVHWDETFPHIHLSGLPSVQNVYEQDVYSQHKDPRRRKLLHEKGEVRISFSTERFNPEFFQTFHPRMIEEMESIAREQGKEIDASGLLNGATKEKSFDVQSMSHEERENSVYETNKAKYLGKNNKELEKENQKLASQNLELKEENQRLASQNLELEYMNVQLEDKVETLEAKVNYWQKALQRIKALILKELEKFKNSAFDILENFKQAIILSKPEKLEVLEIEAKSELEVGIEKSIKAVTDVIPDFSVADEIETHFAKTFNKYDKNGSDKQKVGYAKKQILSNLPPEAECFEKEEVLLRAIDDWFDEEKYLKKLKAFRTLEEAQTYMEPRNRAIRAIEQAMKDAPAIIESLAQAQNKIDR